MKRSGPIARKTPLPRSTSLSRTRPRRKPRKGDKPELRREWAAEHESCACCGKTWREFDADLHLHHILGGAYGRPDVLANFVRLCRSCHELAHASKLTRAMMLTLKIESDREHYDPVVLQSYMGTRILEQPAEVPAELRVKR